MSPELEKQRLFHLTPRPFEGTEIKPLGNSTHLSFTGKNQFAGTWKLLESLLVCEMKKEVEGALKKLKQILEERVKV